MTTFFCGVARHGFYYNYCFFGMSWVFSSSFPPFEKPSEDGVTPLLGRNKKKKLWEATHLCIFMQFGKKRIEDHLKTRSFLTKD